MPNNSFYKSKAWNNVRITYALKKHCLCERCGRPVYVAGISNEIDKDKRLRSIVHHKEYLIDNYDDDTVALNEDNLELLCIDCHNNEHHALASTKLGLMFDEAGNLIQSSKIAKRKSALD